MAKVIWTGKNLAAVKKVHRSVRHYPEGAKAHYRDWSQHPDNLHVDIGGTTTIAEIGDSIVKDAKGGVTVVKAARPRAPRALRAVPPSRGAVHHVVAGGRHVLTATD